MSWSIAAAVACVSAAVAWGLEPKYTEAELTRFTDSYGPPGTGPSKYKTIYGWSPPGTGHPVFIFTPGTHMPFDTFADNAILKRMAMFGYVAGEATYNNSWYPFSCAYLGAKAQGIFSGPNSALGKLCARPEADCSKGVAVHGFSQGAHLASVADLYDARVSAELLFGNGNFANDEYREFGYHGKRGDKYRRLETPQETLMKTTPSCLLSGGVPVRTVPMSKIRSIGGGQDWFMGHHLTGVEHQQELTTGWNCGGNRDCIQPDGSGYYVTKAPQRTGHMFFLKDKSPRMLDQTFKTTAEPYGFKANFDWLAAAALKEPAPTGLPLPPSVPAPISTTPVPGAEPSRVVSNPVPAHLVARSPAPAPGPAPAERPETGGSDNVGLYVAVAVCGAFVAASLACCFLRSKFLQGGSCDSEITSESEDASLTDPEYSS